MVDLKLKKKNNIKYFFRGADGLNTERYAFSFNTLNYTKKPCFNPYQLRHCAYIPYSVKTWFLKNLSVHQ